MPNESWRDWVEHRRKIRAPLTLKAAKLALNKIGALAAEGHDPTAVIESSILNGWRGLFAPRDDHESQGTGRRAVVKVEQRRQEEDYDTLSPSDLERRAACAEALGDAPRALELRRRADEKRGNRSGSFAGASGIPRRGGTTKPIGEILHRAGAIR